MPRFIHLPRRGRDLPSPADLARLMGARYVVLAVAGRSGSSLIHSYLDGHGQIAQIPAIWKFHDFLAANPGILSAGVAAIAQRFVAFPAHAMLFDTRQSATLVGQLGESGDLVIRIDRDAFQRALLAALGAEPIEPRRLLYGAVLAYEWCLERDTTEARAVLHHLHHGDWLWPQLLLDRYNLAGLTPAVDLQRALKPDLFIVSLRAPLEIVRSYPALTAAVVDDGRERVAYYERLLHLLMQDWLRARVAAASGVATLGIRLEDVKADRAGVLHALCGALGVAVDDPALTATTYYGEAWSEDSWSERRRSVAAAQPEIARAVCWQDEAFVMGGLAGVVDGYYPSDPALADWNTVLGLLLRAAADPPFTLYPDLVVSDAARVDASASAWDRLSFIERFRALVATQELGPLQLVGRKEDVSV